MVEEMSGTIEEEFLYDVFISYHESDIEWVAESLITFFEGEGIRVCWDNRDFEPGKTVIENKLNAICSSSATVVVLTPDYAKNEDIWTEMNNRCGWDNDEIVEEFCLIPVVLKTCEIPDIFKPLWKLNWTNLATRKFFWTKLIQCVKKQRHSYSSSSQLLSKKAEYAKKAEKQTIILNEDRIFQSRPKVSKSPKAKDAAQLQNRAGRERTKQLGKNFSELDLKSTSEKTKTEQSSGVEKIGKMNVIEDKVQSDPGSKKDSCTPTRAVKHSCQKRDIKTESDKVLGDKVMCTTKGEENVLVNSNVSSCENETVNCSESDSRIIGDLNSSYDNLNGDYDDDSNHRSKLMESLSPRVLSFFVPEDDDLTRKDVEELTFKIEDVFAEEAKVLHENTIKSELCCKNNDEATKPIARKKMQKIKEVFSSPQEQMRYLDSLQDKEVRIKYKFQNCCDCGRKRIYRRLLERFDKAIFSTVNGEKDSQLLASLPISDLTRDENGSCFCPCCERLFHSERALHIHVEQCVMQTWNDILKGKTEKPKR